jgi:nucleosome binding factor SPN SPT16 subunit
VPITSTNKKFLTKDYEADSKYINNAPKHLKKMGSYFRNNLEIDYDGALSDASTRYQNEIDSAINKDEEVSAFKRYSSRIASILKVERLFLSDEYDTIPTKSALCHSSTLSFTIPNA